MPLVMKILLAVEDAVVAVVDGGRAHALQVADPAPGSLIAMAVMISPEQKPGSQRCFCSSVRSVSR